MDSGPGPSEPLRGAADDAEDDGGPDARAMLRATLAAVGVLLCVDAGAPRGTAPATDRRCSQSLFKQIRGIQKEMEDLPADQWPSDCTLYTPAVPHGQLLCPADTLRCFADELSVLQEEWDISRPQVNSSRDLRRLSRKFSESEASCPQCELQEVQSTATFLQALVSTLQLINFQFCPTEAAEAGRAEAGRAEAGRAEAGRRDSDRQRDA